jgi:hypothetical protein
MRWWLLLLLGCDNPPHHVFIALDRDFATFRQWERVDLGDEQIAGHPAGHAYAYLNQRTRDAAYPAGTMIVKAFEPSWELFAMAKRGGGFNDKGARDWEFFRLKLVSDTPVIVSRGIFAFDPDSDGGVGYGSTGSVLDALCNSCHGTPESAATDHVLTPALRPGDMYTP